MTLKVPALDVAVVETTPVELLVIVTLAAADHRLAGIGDGPVDAALDFGRGGPGRSRNQQGQAGDDWKECCLRARLGWGNGNATFSGFTLSSRVARLCVVYERSRKPAREKLFVCDRSIPDRGNRRRAMIARLRAWTRLRSVHHRPVNRASTV